MEYLLQHGWTVKEASHKKPAYYMIPVICNVQNGHTYGDGRWIRGCLGLGGMTKGYGTSFWGSKNVLQWIVVIVAQLYNYTKNHRTVHCKWMNCVACKLYPNNTITKKGKVLPILPLAVHKRAHSPTPSPTRGVITVILNQFYWGLICKH